MCLHANAHELQSTPHMQVSMREQYQIAVRAMRDASHQPWDTAVTTAAKFSVELKPWSLPNSERSAYVICMPSSCCRALAQLRE